MDNESIIRASATNRLAFADLLASLTPEQLSSQSLCGRWDVETVGAHLAAAITTKLSSFAVVLIRNFGNFDKANDAVARNAAKRGVAGSVATIRTNANSRFAPPGSGLRGPLTDVLVHTGDIARPLDLPHDAPEDHVLTALEFLTTGRTVGFVKPGSLNGLKITADDMSFEFGAGDELHGRGIDLMMAMCGRSHALADLAGPGIETLRSRLPC